MFCSCGSVRPAETPPLVARVSRLQSGSRIKKVPGVRSGALEEIPSATVEGICATLQHHVHHGAAVIAELGGKAIVLDFELLNDLDRRLVINVAVGAFALFWSADQRAVNPHFRGCVSLPIRNKVRSPRIIVRGSGPCNLRNASLTKM